MAQRLGDPGALIVAINGPVGRFEIGGAAVRCREHQMGERLRGHRLVWHREQFGAQLQALGQAVVAEALPAAGFRLTCR